MIGQTVLHYRITEKLGAGGMGEVYLATDTKLERKVALKFLPKHFASDPEARARFQREAKALAALHHPNVVSVFDVNEHEGQPFIAMEFLEGQSLKEFAKQETHDATRVIEIAIQIAQGLAAAHKAEIVHRDLKSENISFAKDGRVKIMDFGLATWRGVTQLTKEGSTVGTVAYMSPEQSQGRPVDHRTDLWSLGVVMYELLTQRLPFSGDHEAAVAYSIVNDQPEPITRFKANVPLALQQIINKALSKDPVHRYQSADGVIADLSALQTPGSRAAIPASAPKNRKLLAIGIPVAVAAIAVIIALTWRPTREQPETQTETLNPAVAVIPFENLGSDEDEYFADGITDEITSRLAQIDGLHVISRTSAMQYKDTDKSIRQIGEELDVSYVLEGTILWDKSSDTNRVRIIPQLIQVDNDYHVWSGRYERALTHIFAVQSDIAEQIATALDVTLAGGSKKQQLTTNADAYAYYLQGRNLSLYSLDDYVANSASLYEKAIALDSNFGAAYAALALEYSYYLWDEGFGDQTQRAKVDWAIDRAMTLTPDDPLIYQTLGYFHTWIERDYELALANYRKAKELGADRGEVLWQIAQVLMRQGRWDEAEQSLLEATAHDPRSAPVLDLLGTLYMFLNRYDEALNVNERALTLAPNSPDLYAQRWQFLIWGQGDTAAANQTIRDGMQRMGDLRPLLRTSDNVSFDLFRYRLMDVTPDQVREAYRQKTRRTEYVMEVFDLALAFDWSGNTDSSQFYFDSLLGFLEENGAKSPLDFHNLEDLTVASILACRYNEAVKYGRLGMEVMPVSTCHW